MTPCHQTGSEAFLAQPSCPLRHKAKQPDPAALASSVCVPHLGGTSAGFPGLAEQKVSPRLTQGSPELG